MGKKWFNLLKRWIKWRKLCRKYDSKLTMLFDNVMSQTYEHLETEEDANDKAK